MRIPKIAHFVWGNKNGLPLSRFISIGSFCALNPDFKIYLHSFPNSWDANRFALRGGETVCREDFIDYTDWLKSFYNLDIVYHDNLHGTSIDHPPSFLSDILRYQILKDYGGFYFDTDILFIRPMSSSYIYNGMHDHTTVIISHSKFFGKFGAHRIGLLASANGSRLFDDAFRLAKWSIDLNEYQSAGSEVLQSLLGGVCEYRNFDHSYPDEIIHNLLDSFVYRYSFEAMSVPISDHQFNYILNSFNQWQVGIHWYGGALSEKIDSMNDREFSLNSNSRFLDRLFSHCNGLINYGNC